MIIKISAFDTITLISTSTNQESKKEKKERKNKRSSRSSVKKHSHTLNSVEWSTKALFKNPYNQIQMYRSLSLSAIVTVRKFWRTSSILVSLVFLLPESPISPKYLSPKLEVWLRMSFSNLNLPSWDDKNLHMARSPQINFVLAGLCIVTKITSHFMPL